MAKPENNTVNTAETGRYKVTEKPRGLTVFSHNEERSFDTGKDFKLLFERIIS